MNGTVIDIPGISVSIVQHELQDSTDKQYQVTMKDQHGNEVTVTIGFGKITEVKAHGKDCCCFQ